MVYKLVYNKQINLVHQLPQTYSELQKLAQEFFKIPSEEYNIEFEYKNWKGFVIRMQKEYEYFIFKKLT
jgi:hypothetical protein